MTEAECQHKRSQCQHKQRQCQRKCMQCQHKRRQSAQEGTETGSRSDPPGRSTRGGGRPAGRGRPCGWGGGWTTTRASPRPTRSCGSSSRSCPCGTCRCSVGVRLRRCEADVQGREDAAVVRLGWGCEGELEFCWCEIGFCCWCRVMVCEGKAAARSSSAGVVACADDMHKRGSSLMGGGGMENVLVLNTSWCMHASALPQHIITHALPRCVHLLLLLQLLPQHSVVEPAPNTRTLSRFRTLCAQHPL